MSVRILQGDALAMLRTLDSGSVQCVVTSPPYFQLRDYGVDGQIGLERTPAAFLDALYAVFDEVRRVLRDDGVVFCNIGDSYAGSGKGPQGNGLKESYWTKPGTEKLAGAKTFDGFRPKSLMLIPERFAIGMADRGWIVRSRMPWLKANCMPESVRDRPVSAIEWVFMFAKQGAYYWDAESVRRENTPGSLARHGKGPERPVRDARMENPLSVPNGRLHEGNLNRNGMYTSGRSFRNSDLFWSHVEAIKAGNGLLLDEDGDPLALLVNPKPSGLEHFAAYPDTLVEPLIRAATSEKGQCPACGAPWRRVVERTAERFNAREGAAQALRSSGAQTGGTERVTLGVTDSVRRATTGWEPGCACDAGDPVPQVVLDPFLGSGTTLVVADRLGRSGVGVELNPAYAEMARRRIEGDAPMFADVEVAS